VKELSSYVFSPLREGDISLYRGSGNGLTPILLAAAEEGSLGCVERLEHEYALKAELDADWAARPVALTRYDDRMTLVLEDPGGVTLDRLLGRPLEFPAKATRLNRAGPGYKVIRLRRLSHTRQALQRGYPRPKSLDLLKRVVAVLPRWKLAGSL
jgi:hypothetical protein